MSSPTSLWLHFIHNDDCDQIVVKSIIVDHERTVDALTTTTLAPLHNGQVLILPIYTLNLPEEATTLDVGSRVSVLIAQFCQTTLLSTTWNYHVLLTPSESQQDMEATWKVTPGKLQCTSFSEYSGFISASAIIKKNLNTPHWCTVYL